MSESHSSTVLAEIHPYAGQRANHVSVVPSARSTAHPHAL